MGTHLRQILAICIVLASFATNSPADCPGDPNGDGAVNIDDLLLVIASFGPCPMCPADVNGTGVVDIDDLLIVIGGWGPCPDNDLCDDATPLAIAAPVADNILGATPDVAPACAGVVTGIGRWYTVIGNGDVLTISTCDSPLEFWDGKLTVYAGAGCGVLACVAASDFDVCFAGNPFQETVSWCSVAGAKYWILVHADFLPMPPDGNYVIKVIDGAACP